MELDAARPAPAPDAAEQVIDVPLAGTRAQAIQRLQVGLCGLAAMVLLVGLANVILATAQQNQAEVVPESVTPLQSERPTPPPVPSNPLADAGVVPNMPAETAPVRVEPVDPAILGDALEPAR